MSETLNVGLVKAIFVGETAPANTVVLWYDSVNNVHKSYNSSTLQWEPLIEAVLIDNATIKKDLNGKLYVDTNVLPGYTLVNGSVTLLKMADVATSTIFYRKSVGSGVPEVQTLATLKTDLGLQGNNSGDQDLSGLVPNSRTINEKPLSGNIVLTPTDIGSPSGSGSSTGENTGDETEASILNKLNKTSVISEEELEPILEDYVLKVEGKSLILDTEITRLSNIKQSVYSIKLPVSSTVAGRVAGTIEYGAGTDGWTLEAGVNPVDLKITHDTERRLVSVSIFAESETNGNRMLVPFSTAYSGIVDYAADNYILIESLSSVELPLLINFIFS